MQSTSWVGGEPEGAPDHAAAHPSTAPPSICMTLPHSAGLVGVSETFARQRAREGRWPGAFQMGRRWLVLRSVFEAELEALALGLRSEDIGSDRILTRALDEARLRRDRRAS